MTEIITNNGNFLDLNLSNAELLLDEYLAPFSPSKEDNSRIKVDCNRVIAELSPHDWWLITERAFLASCSSSWGWGVKRHPAVKISPNIYEDGIGQSDPLEELGKEFIVEGLKKAIEAKNSGTPQVAAELAVIVVELYNTYTDGWGVDETVIKRLRAFREKARSYQFCQTGYTTQQCQDNHAIVLADPKAVVDFFKYTHSDMYCYGVAQGPIYYVDQDTIVGDPINQIWHAMRKPMKAGEIVWAESAKDLECEYAIG